MRARYITADVFTDVPFAGNQLAVFPDAEGIPEELLLPIAKEFNFSETTFVYPPRDPAHTRRVRIFTPAEELPFAGHPTVGTAHVLAAIGELALAGDVTRFVFEEGVGPVAVDIRARDGAPVHATLSVARLPERGPPAPPREALAAMLGLDEADLHERWEPAGWSCGVPFLFVPLRDRGAIARARIRADRWETVLAGWWSDMVMVFTTGGERAGSDIRARMFAPGINVPEDPATGSACAALAGYLADVAPAGSTLAWVVEQGFEMGRPSIIEVEAAREGGRLTSVRVGGASVLVGEGSMRIPERARSGAR